MLMTCMSGRGLGRRFQYSTFANHVISGHFASFLTPFLLHLPDFNWGVLAYQNLYYLIHLSLMGLSISIYHLYYISCLSYSFLNTVSINKSDSLG
jgi:hypothetical protein